MQLPGSRVPVGGHDHGQWTHPSQLNTKQPPKWRGWPGQRLAGSLFSKTEGAASEWAQAHSCSHTLGGEERYNLKTACKSVKQISIAWISQIIEPQSITNVQCIWPSGEPQLKYLQPGHWKRELSGRGLAPHPTSWVAVFPQDRELPPSSEVGPEVGYGAVARPV